MTFFGAVDFKDTNWNKETMLRSQAEEEAYLLPQQMDAGLRPELQGPQTLESGQEA